MTKGLYVTNGHGDMECRHGVLLYGASCVQCERDADTATGWSEQIRWAEGLARAYERTGRMGHDMGHINCRCTINPRHADGSAWQGTYTRNPVEIITDPDDTRGVNARRVYPINRSATL